MRKIIRMNEDWMFALHRGLEPMEKGDADALEYFPVTLPHDWQISSPFNRNMEYGTQQGYFDRWGIGWYKKEFVIDDCSEIEDAVYHLCFDGVYENSSVWVNDIPVGGRKYGYSGFALDISRAVRRGKNRILVKVDNTTMPSDRWYGGAGIYRKVCLEILPKEHLEKEAIQVLTHVEVGVSACSSITEESISNEGSSAYLRKVGSHAMLAIHTGTELPVRAVLRAPCVNASDSGWESEDFASSVYASKGKTEACVDENQGKASDGSAGDLEKTVNCPENKQEQGTVYVAEGCGEIRLSVPDPILWSAEQPALYDLTLQLLSGDPDEQESMEAPLAVDSGVRDPSTDRKEWIRDEISMRIGLRSVELSSEKGLFVNGQSVKLKGVCLHQEAGVFGTAVQPEIWRARLLELKKTGCNALRLAHHLFMPEMLDLCDELGFYVYEECFDKWTGGAYGRFYPDEWQRDIDTMVLRDRNHPSILFWGVGNEVENQAYPSMLVMLERHVARVKALDATRPVSVAMNPHFTYPSKEVDLSQVEDIQKFVDEAKEGEITDIDDRIGQIGQIAKRVDLLCCNYQEQWYERIHERIPDKAILGTETYMFFRGQDWVMQNYSDENPWWDVEKLDYCIGGMIWTGIDYLGESMGWPSKGWAGSLFSTDMEKRPIAWIHQSHWTTDPMVRFAVMDYTIPSNGTKESWDSPRYETHWDFPQFQGVVLPYMIATNCEQVRLFVNERELLLKPTAEYPNRVINGYVPYLPGKVTVIGQNGGKEVCRQEIETTSAAVRLRFEKEEQTVFLRRTLSAAQAGNSVMETVRPGAMEVAGMTTVPYQMLLKVRAFDAEKRPVFRESAQIRFVVEGPAEIVGVDNGDILRDEPVVSDRIHLFHGQAAVALRITGAGRVKVMAYGSGLFSDQTVVIAEIMED